SAARAWVARTRPAHKAARAAGRRIIVFLCRRQAARLVADGGTAHHRQAYTAHAGNLIIIRIEASSHPFVTRAVPFDAFSLHLHRPRRRPQPRLQRSWRTTV